MSARPAGSLLVTGLYRSGTTLLEKMVHAHPALCVGSQPFPALYQQAKAAFLASRGLERRYPLDHLFLEDGYTPAELYAFLDDWVIDAGGIDALFDALAADKKGLWTPEILSCRDRVKPGQFLDVARQMLSFVGELFPKNGLQYVGSKEILCEEFVPYLLARGWHGIIVIRDPRSVIASTNYGRYSDFTGDIRPTLYTVRNWRKSVAISLACQSMSGFLAVKYEDLVSDPIREVNRVCALLDISDVARDAFERGLRTQRGEQWAGNSSFGALSGIESLPEDRPAEKLPAQAVAYVEATCLPELAALGYPFFGSGSFDEEAIRRYVEPFDVRHQKFDKSYSVTTERVRVEIERYARLVGPPLSASEARRWFLHATAYERLRRAARSE